MNMTRTEGGLLAAVFICVTIIFALVLIPGAVIPVEEPKVSVIAEGYVKLDISAAVVASCPVWVYESQTPIVGEPAFDTATTDANGKYVLTVMVSPGQTLWVQVRQAVPASADPYIATLQSIIIPAAAESGDTVPVGTIYVRDQSGNAPTLGVSDGVNPISDNSLNYINTTDTRLLVTVSGIDSDTWYGSGDFTDWVTGKTYWGMVFVWKGTTSQTLTGYDAIVNTPDNVFYIWKMSSFKNAAAFSDDDFVTITITSSTNLVADATVLLNIYDVVDYAQMLNGVFTTGGLTVTTITTKVAT